MKIWKYTLDLSQKVHKIGVPGYGRFLDMQEQNGKIVAWFIVDEKQTEVERLFTLIPTGAECNVNETLDYRKTVQFGECVLHCFEYITNKHVNWR